MSPAPIPPDAHGRKRRWAWPAAAIALALAAGGLAWRAGNPAEVDLDPQRLTAATAVDATARSVPPLADTATSDGDGASRPVEPAAPSTPNRHGALEPALLASIEQQWCDHYSQAHEQGLQSLKQTYGGAGRPLDPAQIQVRIAATKAMPTERARDEVQRRVLARWIATLDQAGDARSAAIANYLVQRSQVATWPERDARARVAERRALESRDPLLLEMHASAELECETRQDCRFFARRRWQALEPTNLAAWLNWHGGGADASDRLWPALAQVRYVRSYVPDIQARLLDLLSSTERGLEREVGLGLIERIDDDWPRHLLGATLIGDCELQPLDAAKQAACLNAANVMWNDPHSSELVRHKLAAMAQRLDASADALWGSRIEYMKARFTAEELQRLSGIEFGEDLKNMKGCESHEARLSRLRARVAGGLATPQGSLPMPSTPSTR